MRYIFFLLLFYPIICFARIEVSIQPTELMMGESAELIFKSNLPIQEVPDLSGLEGNFALAGQRPSEIVEEVNGRYRRSFILSYNLFPRKEGELSTGPIPLGKNILPAVSVNVLPAKHEHIPVHFEAFANKTTVYLNEPVLYTVRIIDQAGVIGGKMTNPIVPNALVKPLNLDRVQQGLLNNLPVQVSERTFAIIPEKPGILEIPSIELYGRISKTAQYFETPRLYDGTKNDLQDFSLKTNALSVNVLPPLNTHQDQWLPSTNVQISVQDDFPEQISVGDSLTRHIRLTADNILGEQLIEPNQPINTGLMVYPSSGQRKTTITEEGYLRGQIDFSVVLVPTESGDLRIPEISVPWFNTTTNQLETAVIPPILISVQAGKEQPSTPQLDAEKLSYTPKKIIRDNSLEQIEQTETLSAKTVLFIGLGIFILLLCIKIYFIFNKLKNNKKNKNQPLSPRKKKRSLPELYPF